MKLIYYPGCTLKNSARNFDVSTVSSMAELDVEVEELDRWNCCGTVHALGAENVMNRVAPVTNLIRVQDRGYGQRIHDFLRHVLQHAQARQHRRKKES
jgi:heterodisulfide reductase subunit B